jgi:hypothetical protein
MNTSLSEECPESTIRIPTSSDASEVRMFAREAGRRSLFFFLSNILELRVREDVCILLQQRSFAEALSRIRTKETKKYLDGYSLWLLVREDHGIPVPDSDALRWLYPEQFAA